MRLRQSHRRGTALVVILVILAAIAAGTTAIVWNGLATRKFLQRRENALQAEWLARGGIELANARRARNEPLATDWRPLGERATVKISVADKEGRKAIVAEATYPADEPRPAVRDAEFRID